ncbi:DUF72 domain-containing protein [bacterium]|nr:DUF72 domain-containing protein [bacterium]
MGKFWVGTSGFSYQDWKGKFYPRDLPSRQWLEYYSQRFSALEINSSFYHFPSPTTFLGWYKRTPAEFVFSLKVNRRFTHYQRLKIVKKEWEEFKKRAFLLKEKLKVFLFQLPPSFQKDMSCLENFLKKYHCSAPFVFEFRHSSWFEKEVFDLLSSYSAAVVFHDAEAFPQPPLLAPGKLVYIRFHGREVLYNYQYSSSQLQEWAGKIRNWLQEGKEVFAFFNNDPDAFAVFNAQELEKMVKG